MIEQWQYDMLNTHRNEFWRWLDQQPHGKRWGSIIDIVSTEPSAPASRIAGFFWMNAWTEIKQIVPGVAHTRKHPYEFFCVVGIDFDDVIGEMKLQITAWRSHLLWIPPAGSA